MQVGLAGLGKMGSNLALNMMEHGHQIVAYDISMLHVREMEKHGITGAYSVPELVAKLPPRRVIWLMIPAGDPVQEMIDELMPLLSAGDIVIEGGNSHYKDTLKRAAMLKEKGLHYVDIGTSGGLEGARHGACTMIGAEDEIFAYLEPLIKDISLANGYLHTGANGSGHYVKMIHNGIEYGMMQAIGEGFEILEQGPFELNFQEIARVWNHGSVIRSWLLELAERAFAKDTGLAGIKGVMHSSGEGLWTVQEALELGVAVPVITEALLMRYRSQKADTFTGRVVAALRNEFGGHAMEKQ